jgi:peptidoglycan/LPS O-acetylase OafA/YrhL
LAAVIVVVHHLVLSDPRMFPHLPGGLWWLERTPLHLVWAGHEAVILFFVLSGFVLSLPQVSGNGGVASFYIRRLLRIYPAFLVALLLGIAGDALFFQHRAAGQSTWFYAAWSAAPDARSIVSHLLLVTPFDKGQFDPVLWSMCHEMRLSLAFPALLLAVGRYDWRLVLAAALAGSFVGGFAEPMSALSSFEYVVMFVAGALMARHRQDLARRFASLPRHAWLAVLAACCALYTVAYWLPLTLAAPAVTAIDEWTATLAACGFIALALWSPLGVVLRTSVAQFLGRISYSLYLLHVLVLLALLQLLPSSTPRPVIWAATVVLAVAAAYACHRWVERPGIRLGRRLAGRSAEGYRGPRRVAAEPATENRQGLSAHSPA